MIQVYLEDQLNSNIQRKTADNAPLIWTANKASLTELIYALHSQGVFNNGNTDIIVIVQILSAKKGISSLQLSRTIDVNKNTAWLMQKRIRNAMSLDPLLSGIVEVDETYIGGALEEIPPFLFNFFSVLIISGIKKMLFLRKL